MIDDTDCAVWRNLSHARLQCTDNDFSSRYSQFKFIQFEIKRASMSLCAERQEDHLWSAALFVVILFFFSFMLGQYPINPAGVVDIIGLKIFGYECSQSSMAW